MMIPGIDTIGGYSIVSTPAHLSETGELSLCVKNSDHPPAHWVHNGVSFLEVFTFDLCCCQSYYLRYVIVQTGQRSFHTDRW